MNIFGAVGHWFAGLWKALSGQLKVDLENFLKSFVKDDLGALAVDAVNFVEAKFQGAASIDKRNEAVDKFKEDLAAAGHDLQDFAGSLLIWFIETALQAVKAGVV